MAKTKITEEVSNKENTEEKVKDFLRTRMPAMFDRTPAITGDFNKFVKDLLELL